MTTSAAAAMLMTAVPKNRRRSWLISSDIYLSPRGVKAPGCCRPRAVVNSLCRGSAEREGKCLHARIEKLDLDLSILDGLRLSDQLIQPRFSHHAVAVVVRVDSVRGTVKLIGTVEIVDSHNMLLNMGDRGDVELFCNSALKLWDPASETYVDEQTTSVLLLPNDGFEDPGIPLTLDDNATISADIKTVPVRAVHRLGGRPFQAQGTLQWDAIGPTRGSEPDPDSAR